MRKLIFITTIFALFLGLTAFLKPATTVEAEKVFNVLYKDFLYNPKDAHFVKVKYKMPSCWGGFYPVDLYGWQNKTNDTIHFIDRSFYLLSSECISVHDTSFSWYVQTNYLPKKENKDEGDDVFDRMHRFARGEFNAHPLMIAAWCHAANNNIMAKDVYDKWKKDNPKSKPDSVSTHLKSTLQWMAFSGMVHHFMNRKDEIAQRYSDQITDLFLKDENALFNYYQAPAIQAELKRRQEDGNFNAIPDSLPKTWNDFSWQNKALFLIKRLDEIDQRQWGQPGGVSLAADWRVQELISIGDSVVPMLIDVIENDKRFTRSVHFWRDFADSRTVLNVKEAALTAIMSIWQDPLFEPAATGDNFTSRGDEQAKALAQQLREQLKTYAGKTLDVRKIEILQDRSKEMYERIEAAKLLANYGGKTTYGTMVWTNNLSGNGGRKNPLIDKYKSPTLAEMIWNEYANDIKKDENAVEYLFLLIDLNDRRIVPTLQKSYENEQRVSLKRYFAYCCYWLGDSLTWNNYCLKVQAGDIALPEINYQKGASIEYDNPARQPGNIELRELLACLKEINNPVSIQTRNIIISPGHPYYKWIEKRLIQMTGGYDDEEDDEYYHDDFCIRILERNLDNKSNSDVLLKKYHDSNGITTILDWGGSTGLRLHDLWDYSDYTNGKEDVEIRARICDMAAYRLYERVFGIPACHGHMKDKDARIERQKAFLKQYTKFRDMTSEEYNTVNELYSGSRFVPDIQKLDHPATEKDVQEGRAIFSMPGNKTADVGLPAWAIHKNDKGKEKKAALKYLLLQAEYTKAGELVYGAMTEDGPKIIKAEDLVNIVVYKGK